MPDPSRAGASTATRHRARSRACTPPSTGAIGLLAEPEDADNAGWTLDRAFTNARAGSNR